MPAPYGGRVEDREVRVQAGLEHAAVVEPHPRGGERGELADRVLQREHAALAHVAAEDAREGAVRRGGAAGRPAPVGGRAPASPPMLTHGCRMAYSMSSSDMEK
jgi:hypothetical protein